MKMADSRIITIGFCPAWDVTCRSDGVDWGQHVTVSQTAVPAGKALNVSKALAWLGRKTIAAGLWGQDDRAAAATSLVSLKPWIDLRLTPAAGPTRHNITVIDTHRRREMHLRAACTLATKATLTQLHRDLNTLMTADSTVVFSGSIPEGQLLDKCLAIIQDAGRRGAAVVIDSSGPALRRVVERGGLSAIKPNLEELGQLLDRVIDNEPSAIIDAAQTLCDQVGQVLVSRGADGAMVITRNNAIGCRAQSAEHKVVNTVACGDYLLAGFLADETAALSDRLENAVAVATARAWGLTETADWPIAKQQIDLETIIF